jgi:hypothetical protein
MPDSTGANPNLITRRKFDVGTACAVATLAATTVFGAPSFFEYISAKHIARKQRIAREQELKELLNLYLYPSNPGSKIMVEVPLVPALKDPWGPPTRTFSGSGNAVAGAYYLAFQSDNDKYIVKDAINVYPDDAPVLIASHLVSEPAARYFGSPHSLHPNHEIHYQDDRDDRGGFSANLRWAIYTPEGEKKLAKLEPFEGTPSVRKEPVHFVSGLDKKFPQPAFRQQGEIYLQQNDYLLITALPRDSRFDRRIISLAGAHKPGTLAAEQLLNDPDLALEILRKIHKEVKGDPYYQALIGLDVDNSSPGSPQPFNLSFVGAEALRRVAPSQ